MRSYNRALALMAGSGVVASAFGGAANTTSGSEISTDFSEYSVVRMYAVYTRMDEESVVEFHPFGGESPDLKTLPTQRPGIPDLSDESVDRYLSIEYEPGRQLEFGRMPMALLKPPSGAYQADRAGPGRYAVQIGEIMLSSHQESAAAAEGTMHLFEIELGWHLPDELVNEAEQTPRIEFIPTPGSVLVLGLGGIISRRRRR